MAAATMAALPISDPMFVNLFTFFS